MTNFSFNANTFIHTTHKYKKTEHKTENTDMTLYKT